MGLDLLIQTLLPAAIAGAIGWWRPSLFWWAAGLAVWATLGWAAHWYFWPSRGIHWLPVVFWAVALAGLVPATWGRLLRLVLAAGVFLLALWPLLPRYPEAIIGLLAFLLWQGWREWRPGPGVGIGFVAGAAMFTLVVAIGGSVLLAQAGGALAVLAGFLWLAGLSRGLSDRDMTAGYVLWLALCWQFIPLDWWVVALALVPPLVDQGLRGRGPWPAALGALASAVLAGAVGLWLVWPKVSLY